MFVHVYALGIREFGVWGRMTKGSGLEFVLVARTKASKV